MTDSADHLRTTGENEWDDLDGPSTRGQQHYTEPQVQRFEHYRGPLEQVPEEKVRALFAEMFGYFNVEGYDGMPVPPAGLPGLNRPCDVLDPPAKVLMLGVHYLKAAALGQGRAMHNRWNDAADLLRSLHDQGRREAVDEEITRSFERARQRDANPGFVYFIGSESGPIKIGTARKPEVRRKELQTSHHEKLSILATCEGGQPLEFEYHARFAAHRLNGEWFERHPDILAEIERLR